MNTKLLEQEVQRYIRELANQSIDLPQLILKGSPFENISIQEIAAQVAALRKVKNKVPTYYHTPKIFYPPTLNLEQTSSEATAIYKAGLVKGKTLIDFTGGFGIDTYFLSKNFEEIHHCELNTSLSHIAAYNFKVLKAFHITCFNEDGLSHIRNHPSVDCIYIDPSRRNESKGKVFLLEDCMPNVPGILEELMQKAGTVLIKTSPLLDITNGLNSLKQVSEIHIVAVKNDVKELLWVLTSKISKKLKIQTVNLNPKENQYFSFDRFDKEETKVSYSLPLKYLYEPNAAIMKSGGFNEIANQFNLFKLHPNTHLYTSESFIEQFPGRIFIVKETLDASKSELKKSGIKKANITTRNYPENVSSIRKKYKINEGGNLYIFFTTLFNQRKVVLKCKKTQNTI